MLDKSSYYGLSDYIADNYGTCNLIECQCLRKNIWIGRECPFWIPTHARTWKELLDIAKRQYDIAK